MENSSTKQDEVPCEIMKADEKIINPTHIFFIIPGNGPGVPWWECKNCHHTVQSN